MISGGQRFEELPGPGGVIASEGLGDAVAVGVGDCDRCHEASVEAGKPHVKLCGLAKFHRAGSSEAENRRGGGKYEVIQKIHVGVVVAISRIFRVCRGGAEVGAHSSVDATVDQRRGGQVLTVDDVEDFHVTGGRRKPSTGRIGQVDDRVGITCCGPGAAAPDGGGGRDGETIEVGLAASLRRPKGRRRVFKFSRYLGGCARGRDVAEGICAGRTRIGGHSFVALPVDPESDGASDPVMVRRRPDSGTVNEAITVALDLQPRGGRGVI